MLKLEKQVGKETTLEYGKRVYNGIVIVTGTKRVCRGGVIVTETSYAFKTESGGEIPLYEGKVRIREGRLGQNEGRLVCLV